MVTTDPLRDGEPTHIGGRRLLGRLGAGGQGVVYLGEDRESGRQVAVKLLHAHLGGDEKAKSYLSAELDAMLKVAPFCTARVLAADLAGDRPYIVSEYVDGPSLQEIVTREGPRESSALIRLAIGTATALAAIHQAGVVHRDFKPGNVLIGSDGPRVIDFGIAKVLDLTASISADVVGTPSYMAPEQLRGERLTSKIDIFAWGCTMVYAATGRAPFGHEGLHAVMNRILNERPTLDGVDPGLRPLVESCLAKDPAQRPTARALLLELLDQAARPSGAAEMLSAGASIAGAESGDMTMPPPISIGKAWTRRRLLVTLSGAGALVAAGGTAAYLALRKQDGPVPLPGIRGDLLPDAGGPLQLTSYTADVRDQLTYAYVLDERSGTFAVTPYRVAVVSPDRRYVAGIKGEEGEARSITVTDRRTGKDHEVRFDTPVMAPRWSPTANRLAVTLLQAGNIRNATGCAIVSPDRDYEPRIFTTTDHQIGAYGWPLHPGAFSWNQNGTSLVAARVMGDWGTAVITTFTTDGKPIRTYPPTGPNVGCPFSPDGKLMATQVRFAGAEGEGGKDQVTIWDGQTGLQVRVLPTDLWFLGWYDSQNVIGYGLSDRRVHLVGVDGTPGRSLITNTESPLKWNLWPFYSPRKTI